MAKNVMAGTDRVLPNEPCYGIAETNKPAPDSKSVRRYRRILVSRGDSLAEYIEDLGRADAYPNNTFVEQLVKTGGMDDDGRGWSEHTVAEAIALIEFAREPKFDMNDLPRLRDLEDGYQSVIAQRKRPKNRTVFGYGN